MGEFLKTLVWVLLFTPLLAQAEGAPRFWLTADYTYTDFKYKEPGRATQDARFAGIRGDVGFNLFGGIGVSAGGEYADGHTDYEGTPLGGTPMKTITNDYIRTMQYLIHFTMGSMVISAGQAERYWYNDLVTAYRSRTRYNYIPVMFSYRGGPVYFRVQHDLWQKGWNKTHMSDVNATSQDVEFKLGTGKGYGVELGYVIPGMLFTRIFVNYHKWDIKASDTQSDGTQNLTIPANSLTEIKAGIGFAF